mmetsp:Transcript_16895/g.30588  ORF Transcript_16895/g.30588 Transcript_16895/m.30588 type:complete len:277 (+) Transcript_16895:1817-2647(+)
MTDLATQLERLLRETPNEAAERITTSFLVPLTPGQEDVIDNAINGMGSKTEVLNAIQGTGTSIQCKSMERFQPEVWLNDECINYIFGMLNERDSELHAMDPNRKRNFFATSHFMAQLLDERNANPSKHGKYNFENVKSWFKAAPGKDIFDLGKIFIPVNHGFMHWMCAMIDIPGKRIYMYDSMGDDGMNYLQSLLQYLQDKHLVERDVELPDIDEWELFGHQPGMPTQQNGFDCGVFTCLYAAFLGLDLPLVFSQEHMNHCRRRLALSIMHGSILI